MANDSQYKISTRIVATRGVREYRRTIEDLISADDVVLEVGCEWGTTTKLLNERAGRVVGTDISPVCIERGRAAHPELDLRVFDAFDLRALLRLGLPFTKVYMDLSGLSGSRGLLDLIALINSYASVVVPETVVVKSGALKHFAQMCRPWPGEARAVGQSGPVDADRSVRGSG